MRFVANDEFNLVVLPGQTGYSNRTWLKSRQTGRINN